MPFAVAAGIGAVGSIASGLLGSSAASSAADTQSAAARDAAALQDKQYQQTRTDLSPFREQGVGALAALSSRLADLSSPFNPTKANLEATPGYQFVRDQGLRAVQNGAAAKGLGISGAALRGAEDYATGLADSTYQTQFNIDQANKTNAFNKLMGLVGVGQSAAAQTSSAGQAAAKNSGDFLTSGANASAAGDIGAAKAIGSGLGGASNAYSQYALLNKLFPDSGGFGSLGKYY